MKTYTINGFKIETVKTEPCYKLSMYLRGDIISCNCSVCIAKGESHEVIKARLDKIYQAI